MTIGEVGGDRWAIYLDYWGGRGDWGRVWGKDGRKCGFGLKVGHWFIFSEI